MPDGGRRGEPRDASPGSHKQSDGGGDDRQQDQRKRQRGARSPDAENRHRRDGSDVPGRTRDHRLLAHHRPRRGRDRRHSLPLLAHGGLLRRGSRRPGQDLLQPRRLHRQGRLRHPQVRRAAIGDESDRHRAAPGADDGERGARRRREVAGRAARQVAHRRCPRRRLGHRARRPYGQPPPAPDLGQRAPRARHGGRRRQRHLRPHLRPLRAVAGEHPSRACSAMSSPGGSPTVSTSAAPISSPTRRAPAHCRRSRSACRSSISAKPTW